jgi:phage regulator Rha-like protein
MSKLSKNIIHDDVIVNKIYYIRGEKVMLDRDLSELYGVSTGRLNEQVKRNISRFPEDFMFRLTKTEFQNLISQNATSSWGGTRKLLYVFTEQGVAMLSSVLNSDRAIQVNIQIIKVYTKMRQFLATHKDILLKLEQLERKTDSHDEKINLIFEYIKQLIRPKPEPKKQIGYKISGAKQNE